MIRWTIIALLTLTIAAHAHSWYPSECCSGKDCRELMYSEVTTLPNGWEVHGHWFVPRGRERTSPDDRFHGCFPSGVLGCFYAPKPSA